MRNFTSMLVLTLLLSVNQAFAQTRDIVGAVVDAATDSPVIGATVILEGTSKGDVTDANGEFRISGVSDVATLEVTFLGYKTEMVDVAATQTHVIVKLYEDALSIDELVVTGLGVTREKKALGYAVQEVGSEEITKARTSNVVNSLSGRVAGVQITSSSGQIGGGAKINIRGNSSLTGNNQPLFVVDGVPISSTDYSEGAAGSGGYDLGGGAGDINPDDIESISVLKGAGATAIYGSRGANGVVLITTKKAKESNTKTFGVSVNSQVTIDTPGIMPVYQKLYGGGSSSDPDKSFSNITINGKSYRVTSFVDESWGPAYDPNLKVLGWNSFDAWDTANYLVEKPWVYPENDYTTFYQNGVGTTNNIQISGANQGYTYRLSYTNLSQTGIIPGSKLLRHTVSFNGTADINKNIDTWVAVNYVENKGQGRPETGYADRNVSQKMWQWTQTQLDYKELQSYINPDGTQRPWNRTSWDNGAPMYNDNPYWSLYENYQNDRRDRVYGNAGVNLKFFDDKLKITGRAGMDMFRFRIEERMAVGSVAESHYRLIDRFSIETNFDLFGTYNDRYANEKVGLTVMIGTSSNDRKYNLSGGVTNGGLVVPGIYNLSNSVNLAKTYDSKDHKRINSVYGNATIDYNQLIYLDVTARNDWSSTLPAGNRSYFYPSFNLSVILSQLPGLRDLTWLDFAKIRGGWSQVGNDSDPYTLARYYYALGNLSGDPLFSNNQTLAGLSELNNAHLKPERTNSWEVGLEATFLNRRLSFDVAYFDKEAFDQIVPMSVSAATGYRTIYMNSGRMSNKGVELTINATPIETKSGFRWDLSFNMATLKNRVNSLTEGVDYLSFSTNGFNIESGAYVGTSYPIIYGTDYQTDEYGNRLISTTGQYEKTEITNIGNATPNFTAGLSSTFTFKGFDLSILFDMQLGGHMYYISNAFGVYSGILEESAQQTFVNGKWGNIREHGIVLDGVYGYKGSDGKIHYTDANGNPSDTPVKNTTALDARTYAMDYFYGVDAQSVFKTDYIKLREIRLGYTFPRKLTGPIKDIRLSFFGRNLATFMRDSQHFDPEYTQAAGSNIQGLEGGYIPSTRTYGVGLSFNF